MVFRCNDSTDTCRSVPVSRGSRSNTPGHCVASRPSPADACGGMQGCMCQGLLIGCRFFCNRVCERIFINSHITHNMHPCTAWCIPALHMVPCTSLPAATITIMLCTGVPGALLISCFEGDFRSKPAQVLDGCPCAFTWPPVTHLPARCALYIGKWCPSILWH